MSYKDFILSREGATATIWVKDWQGEEVFIYRADDYNRGFRLIDTTLSDTFTDTGLDPRLRYKYYIRVTDLEDSINILEYYPEDPIPYYEAEPVGETVFTPYTDEIEIPWGDNVYVNFIEISNLQVGRRSIAKYTTRQI